MGTPEASRAKWHEGCAEIVCLDKALNDGADSTDDVSRTVNIGISGDKNNIPKSACSSCRDVLKRLGIAELVSLLALLIGLKIIMTLFVGTLGM